MRRIHNPIPHWARALKPIYVKPILIYADVKFMPAGEKKEK